MSNPQGMIVQNIASAISDNSISIIKSCIVEEVASDYITVTESGKIYSIENVISGLFPLTGQIRSGDMVLCLLSDEQCIAIGLIKPVSENTVYKGDKIDIRADKSLLLECGNVSISLDSTGKIEINGKQIYQHADNILDLKGSRIFLN